MRLSRLTAVVLGTMSVAAIAGIAPASAHVTVSGQNAVPGGYATLTFKVPNEEANATTVGLTVKLPANAPLASVSELPLPGWTFTTKTAKPATPIQTDDGPVDEIVTEVTWTAQSGVGIKAGQFQQFVISAGPLPDKAGDLIFAAVQTYSNGQKVSWSEVAAPGTKAEPEHPAPVLTVGAPAPTGSPAAAKNGSSSGRSPSNAVPVTLSIIALVLAAGALGVALLGRRRRAT